MLKIMASALARVPDTLTRMSRSRKRALMVAADILCIPLALWCALGLRFGTWPSGAVADPWFFVAAVLVSVPIFAYFGLYRTVVRFIGSRALGAVLSGVSASVAVLAALDWLDGSRDIPLGALAIYWMLAVAYVDGSRVAVRRLLNGRTAGAEAVAIYGAGSAGVQAVAALRLGRKWTPVAFLDDDPSLHGSVVADIKVYSPADLNLLVRDHSVATVLLAMPSQTRRRRHEVLKSLESSSVRVMSVPDIGDLLLSAARIDDVREIDSAELLGREPVLPNQKLFDACNRDKVVLVTGAGGSIGAELCRQIARLGPKHLVLFELSEFALYQIERELREIVECEGLRLRVTALLGNVQNKDRLCEIARLFGVQTVYHAAAYKHVPIVEENVIEGICNNVIGTWRAAEAALECGVESFVLVSTDKAVNPTSVMGATKRLAEIVLQGMQQRGSRTRFCMVRFGNVLESSGSVVPLFRKQIENGGPITVTHPDVIRYFMTITEASQLVLQAGGLAGGGDVFVLDMGRPVRIAELAHRMVRLAGLTVRDENNTAGDIEIRYTGLRPAEKLYEELLIGGNVSGTEHPMIMRATDSAVPWSRVQEILEQLYLVTLRFDVGAAHLILREAVAEYRPPAEFVDMVWRQPIDEGPVTSNVTSIGNRRSAIHRD